MRPWASTRRRRPYHRPSNNKNRNHQKHFSFGSFLSAWSSLSSSSSSSSLSFGISNPMTIRTEPKKKEKTKTHIVQPPLVLLSVAGQMERTTMSDRPSWITLQDSQQDDSFFFATTTKASSSMTMTIEMMPLCRCISSSSSSCCCCRRCCFSSRSKKIEYRSRDWCKFI